MKPTTLVIDACQFSANYNYCLLDAMARNGERIVYATTEFAHGHIPDPPGVSVFRCFFFLARAAGRLTSSGTVRRILRAIEYPLNVLILAAYVLARRIRVVHLMWVVFPALDYWLIRLLQGMGCRVVYTAHNPLPHEPRPGDVRRYCRIYHRADRVIALTRYTRDEIVANCGLAPGKISVLPHGDFGALFAQYGTNDKLSEMVREKARGRKIIAFLGHIRPYKGLRVFVDAFSAIQQEVPDAFFLVAGSVNIGDSHDWDKELAPLSASGLVWDDIRFLPVEDFKAYLSVIDVLVQPYLRASQSGNTVMAYAAGVPVISTAVGGLEEMTEDGETGYVIPPNDPAALAAALGRCFQANNYETMSQKARLAADGPFNWTSIAEGTAAAYGPSSSKPRGAE